MQEIFVIAACIFWVFNVIVFSNIITVFILIKIDSLLLGISLVLSNIFFWFVIGTMGIEHIKGWL